MNRIEQKFRELKREGKIALMPFVVAGDPDFAVSLEIVRRVAERGDFLEIGFPYSDPLADGPTIQKADARALKAGMTTDRVLEFVNRVREFTDMPITALVYANLVFQRGIEKFYKDAKRAGIDGVLVPDAPVEEAAPFAEAAAGAGIDPVFLVTHTTTPGRLAKILERARGFLYVVNVLGVTGAREHVPQETLALVRKIKTQTSLPQAVGFGISKPSHIQELGEAGADGAIVGSALVQLIEDNLDDEGKMAQAVDEYLFELNKG